MPHTTTMQRRLDNTLNAIGTRTWLDAQYTSRDNNGNPVIIHRQILPFRIYQSGAGDYVVDGYDTYRKSIRTFRLDRFESMEPGRKLNITEEADPCIISAKGQFAVWPAAWNLIQARPQVVSERAVDKFLAHGWSLTPCKDVLVKPS